MVHQQYMEKLLEFIPAGTKVFITLEFGESETYNFQSQLIGYKNHQCIIIDYPKRVLQDLIIRKLRNIRATVRAKSNSELGHVIAFRTNILDISTQPFPMIFLKMPHDYMSKAIREHHRFKFSVPVEVHENERCHKGRLIDFSVSGCGVLMDMPSFIEQGDEVEIKMALIGENNSHFTGKVINIIPHKSNCVLGVSFDDVMPFDTDLKSALFEHCHPDVN
ncbi:flagellar brake protein [Vibrio sp.]|uniref:Flagellar brake protein n=1 Tax=Vibrio viridaestus TaxID=2487322 RepID=A0A3N9U507_9VIBR|nr:flagellar brake protein [Vibrio viridaestus]MDC0609449.1 flagellar brake protein [Vibrio sp.]RQW64782.1 flagellar brake protein [Vibrio viridaestus]